MHLATVGSLPVAFALCTAPPPPTVMVTVMFALLAVSALYLRQAAPSWPPAGIPAPAIGAALANVIVPDSMEYRTSRKVTRPPSSSVICPVTDGSATVPRACCGRRC